MIAIAEAFDTMVSKDSYKKCTGRMISKEVNPSIFGIKSDGKFDAIVSCGQPDYLEETSTEGNIQRGQVNLSEEKVEKLYYNRGDSRFIEILTIKNERIVSIDEGERGSGPVKCG